jgi:uncharacterized NAD(P)/FAD-binding protein YdhS
VDLLVVGGGFAGLMTAVHVRARLPLGRIAIIERESRPAPGVAYGACHATHLLNVPAGRMGAFPDAPTGFLEWLRSAGARAAGDGSPGGEEVESHTFVPRADFGRYLNAIFNATLGAECPRTALVRDAVVRIDPQSDDSVQATLAGGKRIKARAALLAIGLPAAAAPWEGRTERVHPWSLVSDPWAPGALRTDAQEDVLVLGSGLTAIDAVLALRRDGHRGRITLLSRHGRLPCPHSGASDPPFVFDRPLVGLPVREILHEVRSAARRRASSGFGWQAVIDAIRPQTVNVWRSWSAAERSRFLERVRPYWEVHRHRAPVEALSELQALRADGALDVVRGELLLASGRPDGRVTVTLTERRRAAKRTREVTVGRLINCAGPAMDLSRSRDPLLRALLADGVATVDAHGLGLRADAAGRVLPRRSSPGRAGAHEGLPAVFLVGALRRGDLWESTAIPELRMQAAEVAAEIVRSIWPSIGGAGEGSVPPSTAARLGPTQSAPADPAPGARPLPRRDATASPPAALLPLLARLRSFDGPIPYPVLMDLLEANPVSAAELGGAIQIDGAAYVRTLVFQSDHVELLVMAWLPGQCSPIHDHAGSGCAVRVVAGGARERLYRKGDQDGPVTPCGERFLGPGEVTGALDEEIHSFGNAASSPASPTSILVTLHAYSPPLKPTRKYEASPSCVQPAGGLGPLS